MPQISGHLTQSWNHNILVLSGRCGIQRQGLGYCMFAKNCNDICMAVTGSSILCVAKPTSLSISRGTVIQEQFDGTKATKPSSNLQGTPIPPTFFVHIPASVQKQLYHFGIIESGSQLKAV